MSKSFGALSCLALISLCCAACGREPSHKQITEKLISGCPCDGPPLSQAQLGQMTEAAGRGDVSVAKKLWDYYLWRGQNDKAAPLEEQLISVGYPDAIGHRSDMLFSEAYHLRDTDPKKLALLEQSLDFEARYRKVTAGRVLHVMINGKYVDIRESGAPDDGTRNMRNILARVKAAQRNG